jgi:hypoxanthine phosphoribosyltransferase
MKKLYDYKTIFNRVHELSTELNKITAPDIVFVCVLNGSFMFFSDLMKGVALDCEVSFIKCMSYENNLQKQDVEVKIFDKFEGKTIILIEDIIDSGKTLGKIIDKLEAQKIHDLYIVSLLVREKSEHLADYYGFKLENDAFIVGYGMDNNNKDRNLINIYEL